MILMEYLYTQIKTASIHYKVFRFKTHYRAGNDKITHISLHYSKSCTKNLIKQARRTLNKKYMKQKIIKGW